MEAKQSRQREREILERDLFLDYATIQNMSPYEGRAHIKKITGKEIKPSTEPREGLNGRGSPIAARRWMSFVPDFFDEIRDAVKNGI